MVPFERKNATRSDKTQLHVLIDTRTRGEATHTRERLIVLIVELTLLVFRVRSSTLSRQQIDPATRMMLEQVSRLSDGDFEQSMMVQLFLNCVDRVTAPSTEFVSLREQPMHVKHNQTQKKREVDPITDEGVWAIKDDGCNSCSHGEVWRQNAEAKMKVLDLHPIWLHRRATTFNGVGTSTTSGKLNIPMAIRLQESDMVTPGYVHSQEILEKTHLLLVSQACQA